MAVGLKTEGGQSTKNMKLLEAWKLDNSCFSRYSPNIYQDLLHGFSVHRTATQSALYRNGLLAAIDCDKVIAF